MQQLDDLLENRQFADILRKYPLRQAYLQASNLPHHNFSHELDVAEQGILLAKRCENYGLQVNYDVLIPACLNHDGGYALPYKDLGFETRERLAMALIPHTCKGYAISRIQETIQATEHNVNAKTIEQKILRAADLCSIAADYEQFLQNNQLLREETGLLEGPVDDRSWLAMTRNIIEYFLTQDIRLTPEHDIDSVSQWHKKVRLNVDKFTQSYT